MLKYAFVGALSLCVLSGLKAQEITIPEPEFNGETVLVVSDTTGVKLARETCTLKASAGVMGVGGMKMRNIVKGTQSPSTAKGSSTTRLIIRWESNSEDPTTVIFPFKFEVTKKERRHMMMKMGTFGIGGVESGGFDGVEFQAKKYGESSYYVVMENLEPGEYGVLLGAEAMTGSSMTGKVTTFTVE